MASKEVQDYLAEQGGAPATVGSEWPGARAECTDVIAAADKVASLNCDLSSEFERSVYNGDEQGAHPADDGRQGGIHPDGRSFQILTPAG